MTTRKTVVLGASPNPERFSYRFVASLVRHGEEVLPLGFRKGSIAGVDIIIGTPALEDIHTVALYLRPDHQVDFYDYILSLKPVRIIFNPGTYNPELFRMAQKQGIDTVINCALVMLAQGIY